MIQKHGDIHKHKLKEAYKKDQAMPLNHSYNKGPRYLRMWVCILAGCSYKCAFDLTHEEPRREYEANQP